MRMLLKVCLWMLLTNATLCDSRPGEDNECVPVSNCTYFLSVKTELPICVVKYQDGTEFLKQVCTHNAVYNKSRGCDCIYIADCPAFRPIMNSKNFSALSQFRACGFEGERIMFCCPASSKSVRLLINSDDDFNDTNTNLVNKDEDSFKITFPSSDDEDSSNRGFHNKIFHGKKFKPVGSDDNQDNHKPEEKGRIIIESRKVKSDYFSNLKEECGFQLSTNVYGGQETEANEFPWMVALGYEDLFSKSSPQKYQFLCAGTLITNEHILTAAHCVPSNASEITFKLTSVRLGNSNLSSSNIIDVEIEKQIKHPEYRERPYPPANDIAILKLSRKLKFDGFQIKPICLPPPVLDENIFIDSQMDNIEFAGWGMTEMSGTSETLKKISFNLTSLEVCRRSYQYHAFKISSKHICAQGKVGQDGCKGDSGGPLMHLVDNIYHVIGISSFGSASCDSSIPSIYTRVSSYLEWIEETVYNTMS